MNTIKDITNFIFIGKRFEELSHYDLLIINADWAEEQLADDLKRMLNKNIIDNNTMFVICDSHQKNDRSSADILIQFLNEKGIDNNYIVDDKYITNPEILKNIDKIVDITKYNRILRVAKDFVARRWYMNASNYDFPIDKCDFYGVVDGRNISKSDWYKSDAGIKQVMKEFINIGEQTISDELSLD